MLKKKFELCMERRNSRQRCNENCLQSNWWAPWNRGGLEPSKTQWGIPVARGFAKAILKNFEERGKKVRDFIVLIWKNFREWKAGKEVRDLLKIVL